MRFELPHRGAAQKRREDSYGGSHRRDRPSEPSQSQSGNQSGPVCPGQVHVKSATGSGQVPGCSKYSQVRTWTRRPTALSSCLIVCLCDSFCLSSNLPRFVFCSKLFVGPPQIRTDLFLFPSPDLRKNPPPFFAYVDGGHLNPANAAFPNARGYNSAIRNGCDSKSPRGGDSLII